MSEPPTSHSEEELPRAGGAEPALDSPIRVVGADRGRRHRHFTAVQELGER